VKRLARRLFAICSAMSLVLCAAVCVLWVRSYLSEEFLMVGGGGAPATSAGTVHLLHLSRGTWLYGAVPRSWFDPGRPIREQTFAHVQARYRGTRNTGRQPIWAVAALTGAPGVIVLSTRLWRIRRTRVARRKGLCPACGYDLRASPGRCPECGTVSATEGIA
jgi:hypothetical protein